jgi:hypothetical protein
LNVKHGPSELYVPKVPGAESVFLLTGLAYFVVFNHAHPGVEKTTYDGVVPRVGVRGNDFTNRLVDDLFGTHDRELDTLDGFDVI